MDNYGTIWRSICSTFGEASSEVTSRASACTSEAGVLSSPRTASRNHAEVLVAPHAELSALKEPSILWTETPTDADLHTKSACDTFYSP